VRYLCLLYADRELTAVDALRANAHVIAAHGVEPGSAVTVRVRGGRILVDAGAAAPLAGVCLVEARDLNDAIQLAARMPASRAGRVEVRAVRTPPPST